MPNNRSENEWRPIPIAPDYEINASGGIRRPNSRMRNARIRVSTRLNARGYPRATLMVDGEKKVYLVHRLVAEAFIGPKPFAEAQIAHWDGDKNNNYWTNLRWTNAAGNGQDSIRLGEKRGSHGKVTAKDIPVIRKRYADGGVSYRELAEMYGFKSPTSIFNIVHGKRWEYVS